MRNSAILTPQSAQLNLKAVKTVAEPASTGVAGLAGWKLVGGLAAVFAFAATLAALVVMCMTPPRHMREWVVGIVSTVIGSIGGGASVIMYLGLQSWAHDPLGLLAMLGVCFSCGIPAWAVVRAVFTYIERQNGKDISEIWAAIRQMRGEQPPAPPAAPPSTPQ